MDGTNSSGESDSMSIAVICCDLPSPVSMSTSKSSTRYLVASLLYLEPVLSRRISLYIVGIVVFALSELAFVYGHAFVVLLLLLVREVLVYERRALHSYLQLVVRHEHVEQPFGNVSERPFLIPYVYLLVQPLLHLEEYVKKPLAVFHEPFGLHEEYVVREKELVPAHHVGIGCEIFGAPLLYDSLENPKVVGYVTVVVLPLGRFAAGELHRQGKDDVEPFEHGVVYVGIFLYVVRHRNLVRQRVPEIGVSELDHFPVLEHSNPVDILDMLPHPVQPRYVGIVFVPVGNAVAHVVLQVAQVGAGHRRPHLQGHVHVAAEKGLVLVRANEYLLYCGHCPELYYLHLLERLLCKHLELHSVLVRPCHCGLPFLVVLQVRPCGVVEPFLLLERSPYGRRRRALRLLVRLYLDYELLDLGAVLVVIVAYAQVHVGIVVVYRPVVGVERTGAVLPACVQVDRGWIAVLYADRLRSPFYDGGVVVAPSGERHLPTGPGYYLPSHNLVGMLRDVHALMGLAARLLVHHVRPVGILVCLYVAHFLLLLTESDNVIRACRMVGILKVAVPNLGPVPCEHRPVPRVHSRLDKNVEKRVVDVVREYERVPLGERHQGDRLGYETVNLLRRTGELYDIVFINHFLPSATFHYVLQVILLYEKGRIEKSDRVFLPILAKFVIVIHERVRAVGPPPGRLRLPFLVRFRVVMVQMPALVSRGKVRMGLVPPVVNYFVVPADQYLGPVGAHWH